MGYVTLFLLGAAAFGALCLLGVRRPLWSMVGAALMLGATGYALQGRPLLYGQSARPQVAATPIDPGLLDLRDRLLGRAASSGDGAYQAAADAMTRAGEPRAAVQAIIGGLRRYPKSLILWVGLGDVLALHDGGRMSPPALFAFQQAIRIAPKHPAPPFFFGLAYLRAGEFADARPLWARALALSPADASYHSDIAVRLALLDRYLEATKQTAP